MQTTRQSELFCISNRKKQTKREEVIKRKEHKERERDQRAIIKKLINERKKTKYRHFQFNTENELLKKENYKNNEKI